MSYDWPFKKNALETDINKHSQKHSRYIFHILWNVQLEVLKRELESTRLSFFDISTLKVNQFMQIISYTFEPETWLILQMSRFHPWHFHQAVQQIE